MNRRRAGAAVVLSSLAMLFWILALTQAQGVNQTQLLVMGPRSSSTTGPTPFRVLAVDTLSRKQRHILSGEVYLSATSKEHMSLAVLHKSFFEIPRLSYQDAKTSSVRVDVDTVIGPTSVSISLPPIDGSIDLEFRATSHRVEEKAPSNHISDRGIAAYPMHGSARSSIATIALVVEERSDASTFVRLVTLKPHILHAKIGEIFLRTTRTRQTLQLDSLSVHDVVTGQIHSTENTDAHLDLYINGRLRGMKKMLLVNGDNAFSWTLSDMGPVPQDALLTLRLTTSFAQHDAGALAFARGNASSISLQSWAATLFINAGGERDEPLLARLTLSPQALFPQKDAQNISVQRMTQALLARLSAKTWKLQPCSQTLASQTMARNDKRRDEVKLFQVSFRLCMFFAASLLLWLLYGVHAQKKQALLHYAKGAQENTSDEQTLDDALLSLSKRERWLGYVVVGAVLGVGFVLDWVLTALSVGKITL